MNKKIIWGIGVIAILALVLSFKGLVGDNQSAPLRGTTNYDALDVTDGYYVDGSAVIDGSGNFSGGGTGAFSTISASGKVTLNAGQLRSYTNATSTTATTQTLVQADILNYDTVLFTPNVGSVTLTLPATSTLTTMIPTAGDMHEQCWQNATSTASINITFAAGTGIDLQRVATSTVTGSAGVLSIPTGNSGCFKFIRQTNTDVQALMTNFIDAD